MTLAFGRARLWGCDNKIATCVGLTIVVVCTWANTVGAVIPLATQRLGIDPTVISGPLITTLVDASGLFLYLTIAVMILGLFFPEDVPVRAEREPEPQEVGHEEDDGDHSREEKHLVLLLLGRHVRCREEDRGNEDADDGKVERA